jgi:hypothetical protein
MPSKNDSANCVFPCADATKMKREITTLILLCLLSSCRYGVTVESFPPARTPRGVMTKITSDRGEFSAELIEVRDTGVVILVETRFRLLPYSMIASSRAEGLNGDYAFGGRSSPTAETRERLRLVSRFPQGLTPELLQKLLEANGQLQLEGENP